MPFLDCCLYVFYYLCTSFKEIVIAPGVCLIFDLFFYVD